MTPTTSIQAVALSLLTASSLVTAFRVTPGSPCASSCSNPAISAADPDFYDKQWAEVVCLDDQYDHDTKGQKAKDCLSCLQTSTYASNGESDQDWFMYNMRYSFDYCLFGYPNSTGFHTNPCMTSEACGGKLVTALEQDISSQTQAGYAFCDAGGGSLTSTSVTSCMQCVAADANHYYISNFLFALSSACKTKPGPSTSIPLNATVFSHQIISLKNASQSSAGTSTGLSTAAIAGIVVGALVIIALVAASSLIFVRKRRGRSSKHERESALEFYCRTTLSRTNTSGRAADDRLEERWFGEKAEGSSSGTVVTTIEISQDGRRSLTRRMDGTSTAYIKDLKGPPTRPGYINTSLLPPSPAHVSPRAFSPDDYTPPTSTVSTRSNAPLLGRNPAATPQSATSSRFANSPVVGPSPLLRQSSWTTQSPQQSNLATMWEQSEGRGVVSSRNPLGVVVAKKRTRDAGFGVGDNVERQPIQTSFPPPPTR